METKKETPTRQLTSKDLQNVKSARIRWKLKTKRFLTDEYILVRKALVQTKQTEIKKDKKKTIQQFLKYMDFNDSKKYLDSYASHRFACRKDNHSSLTNSVRLEITTTSGAKLRFQLHFMKAFLRLTEKEDTKYVYTDTTIIAYNKNREFLGCMTALGRTNHF